MSFQSEVAVYFAGQDDGLERLPLRRVEAPKAQLSVVPARKLIELRDYQQEAFDACLRDLQRVRSSLIVLATGLGKTVLFCKLAEHWEGRILVLAHLEELLQNARDDLMAICGEPVGIERGRDHHEGERIVVGLIQSVGKRLHHFDPNHFSLIIVDEAHHASSEAYRKLFDHFGEAKIVGLTATDSRADGSPLPFDACSYRMGIREGIEDGYLVPVSGKRVIIKELDLSRVKRKNDGEGDFDDSALDDAMVQGAVAIADVLVNDYPFDKGILFFPGCASAKLTAELLNEREPDSAVYIDGTITGSERRALVAKLRNGDARWLANVGIATEGFNWPDASVVGMCSPTLSRPAYVQRAGRGTRPLAGLLNGLSSSSSRRAAIQASNKPSMLILDFVGVSANLDLISAETFLNDQKPKTEEEETFGGNEADGDSEIPDEDEGFISQPNINLRAIAKGVKSRTVHEYDEFNPFEASGAQHEKVELRGSTLGQENSISYKQLRQLQRFGIDDESLTKIEAQRMVGFIASKGFKLFAADVYVLKKLYRDILDERRGFG